jgi:hypothetical protein
MLEQPTEKVPLRNVSNRVSVVQYQLCNITLYLICEKKKVISKKGITGHPKVGHVSPNMIFSEDEKEILIDFIYCIVLQSIQHDNDEKKTIA